MIAFFVDVCLFHETCQVCSNRFVKAISPARSCFTVILEQLRGFGVYKRKLHTNRCMPGFMNLNIFQHMHISSFVRMQTLSMDSVHSFKNEAPDVFAGHVVCLRHWGTFFAPALAAPEKLE